MLKTPSPAKLSSRSRRIMRSGWYVALAEASSRTASRTVVAPESSLAWRTVDLEPPAGTLSPGLIEIRKRRVDPTGSTSVVNPSVLRSAAETSVPEASWYTRVQSSAESSTHRSV